MVKSRLYSGRQSLFYFLLALCIQLFFPASAWAQIAAENQSISELSHATENNEVFLLTTLDKSQAYVQEALIFSIKLYYTLSFERGATFSSLELSPAAFNKLGEDLNYTETVNDILYTVNESRFVIFPQNSGDFTIEPIRFRAFTQTRATRNNPNLKTTDQRQRIELQSESHQIPILPVPDNFPSPYWLPSSNISISENWSRSLDDMRIGDSVVRSIQLNADDLYASMLINLDFTANSSLRSYPAEAQQVDITESGGVSSGHSQNITLVATEAGRFELPAIEIPWWNTRNDSLEFASLPALTLDILTVDGRRLEPETRTADETTQTESIWAAINLNLLLVIGILLAVSVLFFGPALVLIWQKLQKLIRNKRTDGKKSSTVRKIQDINVTYNKLKQACENEDIKATGEQLLNWGQAYFKNTALYNLDKIDAAFGMEDMSFYVRSLQNRLYSRQNTTGNFDFMAFLQLVNKLHYANRPKATKSSGYILPPLYRN
tara:strand:- start:23973 stop:25448 length:1476 start_codon:yes stop_codon:yes gene_type:complete